MCRGICRTSVQAVDFIRPVGVELSHYKFSSGPFWTHELKPRLQYKSISNILHLLSAPDSVPHAVPVLASFVVESESHCKFFLSVISNLIVDSCRNPSRALARRFDHSYASLEKVLLEPAKPMAVLVRVVNKDCAAIIYKHKNYAPKCAIIKSVLNFCILYTLMSLTPHLRSASQSNKQRLVSYKFKDHKNLFVCASDQIGSSWDSHPLVAPHEILFMSIVSMRCQ